MSWERSFHGRTVAFSRCWRAVPPWMSQGVMVYRSRRTFRCLEFCIGKWQQVQQRRPSGEALGNRADQLKLTRSGQNEAPHPAVGIDDGLEVGKKFRRSLDLIKDGPIAHLTEKGPWIFGGEGAGVRILQREVGKLRREQAGKSGFAGLTGTGDGQNREASQSLTRRRRRDPRDWPHRKRRAGSGGLEAKVMAGCIVLNTCSQDQEGCEMKRSR